MHVRLWISINKHPCSETETAVGCGALCGFLMLLNPECVYINKILLLHFAFFFIVLKVSYFSTNYNSLFFNMKGAFLCENCHVSVDMHFIQGITDTT
jgi:hypothetical protein